MVGLIYDFGCWMYDVGCAISDVGYNGCNLSLFIFVVHRPASDIHSSN